MFPEVNIARVDGGYMIRIANQQGGQMFVRATFKDAVQLIDLALHPQVPSFDPDEKPF